MKSSFNYSNDGAQEQLLPIWRNYTQIGLPVTQQPCFKYEVSFFGQIGSPVRLANSVGFFTLNATSSQDLYSSPDGGTWTLRTLPATQIWRGLASNPEGTLYVATGGTNTTQAARSTNGATWSGSTMLSPADWGQVAFGAGLFVAITNGTSDVTHRTSNGTSWTAGTTVGVVSRILFINDRFMVGNASILLGYSTDGINWSSYSPTAINASSIAYGNGRYVAVDGTGVIAISTNGVNFTNAAAVLPATAIMTFSEIGFDAPSGLFVIVNTTVNADIVYTSPDGINWTRRFNYDFTGTASYMLQGKDGLYVYQASRLRRPNRGAMEVTYLLG